MLNGPRINNFAIGRRSSPEVAPDVQFHEDLRRFVWKPRGILDEAAVNKVLADLQRREAAADRPPLQVEMFEEREEAAKWLGVPLEILQS